jgi:hypothetical protein
VRAPRVGMDELVDNMESGSWSDSHEFLTTE